MGAISALRGYRTQFLYSLYKILKDYKNDYVFNPEGEYEDLDILNRNGDYVEIIQIKNKSETLVFSDLLSKKDSFFGRAIKLLDKQDNVAVRLISFGRVSDELFDRKKLSNKLVQKGFEKNKVDKLLENYQNPLVVSETWLNEELIKLIKNIRNFLNPTVTIELLIFWIYKSAEMQKKIKSKEIISTLDSIGIFLNEQKNFVNQFGNTILPFSDRKPSDSDERILQNEFYYGVSAKYEHIIHGLDVHRDDKLEQIKDAFFHNNIVFIHGASGQGKSTLAYRYIYDFSNVYVSYELKLSNNYNEVYETINSLNALSKSLSFPVLVYIDVNPQNIYWNDLLKELSAKNNLHFLITIRQEDWNRTTLGTDYIFHEIELLFNKTEASFIYKSLSNFKKDLKFTDFEESWLKFGNEGLLLEYVYLINQGNTLKSRLKNQIYRLEEEEKISELETLKFVSLSDNYGAKISFKRILNEIEINPILSNKITRHLEKEYLLKFSDNKEYLIGLHPIRSKVLCEILFDENDYSDKSDYVSKAISLIDETDLHTFLLNSFNEGYELQKLEKILSTFRFNSWTGNLNVLKALLWKGVYDFIFIKNNKPFFQLYNKYESIWELILPYDYAEVTEKDLFSSLKAIPENVRNEVDSIRKGISDKKDVFKYIINWFSQINTISINISSRNEIGSLGQFAFWVGYLKTDLEINLDIKSVSLFIDDKTKIEDLSTLILGLENINYSNSFLIDLKAKFKEKLINEFNILIFNETDNEISCKYFIDYLKFEEKDKEESNIFHDKSIQILNLLRKSFPKKQKYSTSVDSPILAKLNLKYDPSIKSIDKKNLPLDYLVEINVLMNSLLIYQFRPESWEEYASKILERRKKYCNLLETAVKSFQDYFKKRDFKVFVEPLKKIHDGSSKIEKVRLPKNISDKWGYISESSKVNSADKDKSNAKHINQIVSLTKYKTFNKNYRDYFFKADNIFNQLQNNILLIFKIYSGNEEAENEIKDYNPNIFYSNLCDALKFNMRFQEEFNHHFSKYCTSIELEKISLIESRNLQALFYCWNQFFNQGTRKISSKVYTNSERQFKEVKENLTKRLKKERKKFLTESGIGFNVILNEDLDKRLILSAEVTPELYFESVLLARIFIQNTIHSGNFTAKSIIINENIESIIYVPLMYGMPINEKAYEIFLHNLEEDYEGQEDATRFFSPFAVIDDKIAKVLEVDFWNKENNDIKNYERIMGDLASIGQFQTQLNSIKIQSENFNCEICKARFLKYSIEIEEFMENRLKETLVALESIETLIEDKELSRNIKNQLKNYNLMELSSEINDLDNLLLEKYHSYVEKAIEKEISSIA